MVSKLFLVLSAVPLVAYFYLFHVRALPLTRVSQNGTLAAFYVNNSVEGVFVDQVAPLDPALLKDDQVRIKIAYATLNPADKKMLSLSVACSARGDGVCGLGFEGSGIVEQSKSSSFKPGDRVFFISGPGLPTLAPYVHVSKEQVQGDLFVFLFFFFLIFPSFSTDRSCSSNLVFA